MAHADEREWTLTKSGWIWMGSWDYTPEPKIREWQLSIPHAMQRITITWRNQSVVVSFDKLMAFLKQFEE